jgi:hypothetical protein
MFFPGSKEYRMFHVLYQFLASLLTLPRIETNGNGVYHLRSRAEFVCSRWLKAIFCLRVALIIISDSTLILRPNTAGLGLQVRNKRRPSCNKRIARPEQNERRGVLEISALNVCSLAIV